VRLRRNQLIQLMHRRRDRRLDVGCIRAVLQYVQKGEFGVVLRCQGSCMVQSSSRIVGEIRTEKDPAQVNGAGLLF
jgi:hypothetical protein